MSVRLRRRRSAMKPGTATRLSMTAHQVDDDDVDQDVDDRRGRERLENVEREFLHRPRARGQLDQADRQRDRAVLDHVHRFRCQRRDDDAERHRQQDVAIGLRQRQAERGAGGSLVHGVRPRPHPEAPRLQRGLPRQPGAQVPQALRRPMTGSVVRDEPVGVLGGLGPAATVHFMARVVELTEAHRDQDHVDLLVWQHGSIPDRSAFLLGHGESPEPVLVADAVALERAGARFIAIPCNTAVVWVEQMRAAVSIEVLDTVAETVAAAQRAVPGLTRLGVLATDGTLLAGTYAAAAAAAGLELLTPSPDVQQEVMSIIYEGVKAGESVSRERFDAVVGHLRDQGAEVVALGCTELSVLHEDLGVEDPTIIDSIDALARRVVLRAGAPLRA